MTRTLVLMRHADPEMGSGFGDAKRRLTPSGRLQANNAGAWLAREIRPQLVLTSSAMRARQTAESLWCKRLEYSDDLYGAMSRTILDHIYAVSDDVTSLVVVAHNPGIAYLAADLAGDDARITGFATATMAVFEITGSWTDLDGIRLIDVHRPSSVS